VVPEFFVVNEYSVLYAGELFEYSLDFSVSKLLGVVELEYVVEFLVGNISIVVAVNLLDHLHNILQLVVFRNNFEEFCFTDRCQQLLFAVEQPQIAAVVHHVWIVGFFVHVHAVVQLPQLHLHPHLTEPSNINEHVLTVRIGYKGLHECISIFFGVDAHIEVIKDLQELGIADDVIIVMFYLLGDASNKLLPTVADLLSDRREDLKGPLFEHLNVDLTKVRETCRIVKAV
jgi:hypothetical protein